MNVIQPSGRARDESKESAINDYESQNIINQINDIKPPWNKM